MRGVVLSLAVAAVLAIALPTKMHAASGAHALQVVATMQDAPTSPARDLNVDINVNHGGGHWYRSPLWIAIGALAVLVILLIVVLAARSGGGGTTIVRE